LKSSRVIGALLLNLQVAGIGVFLLCGQTIFSLLSTVTPSGGGEIPVEVDQQTQVATLTFTFTPRNGGLIAARLNLGFGVSLTDGSFSAKNTTSVYLPPGAQENISLTLKVPVEKLQAYSYTKGSLDIYTSILTLNDLVRLDENVKSEGGG
jgi:hypothetical protein